MKLYLESHIGNTPLICLRRIVSGVPKNIEVYGKAEHLNPGGSVKDRAALAMILACFVSVNFCIRIDVFEAFTR